MAVVTVGSIGLRDLAGKRKSIALYFPNTATVADISTYLTEFATSLDAAIDGVIEDLAISVNVTLPGGLKNAVGGNQRVTGGALLAFDVVNSNYSHSIFIPTWSEEGFSGEEVNNAGVWATVINDLATHTATTAIGPTSEEGNDLVAFLRGKFRPRK